MAPVSMNFGPQNCGAVHRTSVQDQGAATMSKIITIFQRVLIFEQSINHRRGLRSWPQIGAAATWLFALRRLAERLNATERATLQGGLANCQSTLGSPLRGSRVGNSSPLSSESNRIVHTRLRGLQRWLRLSAEAFSVAAASPLLLGRAHAVESREAAGQDSGQALAGGTCLPVLAHRDERHVFPELLLQIGADALLLLQIGRGEPGGAKFLACRRYSER